MARHLTPSPRSRRSLVGLAVAAGVLAGSTSAIAALPQEGGTVDLATQANVILDGPSGSAEAGYSIADAGDVNGDGIDDILIGAHKETPLSRASAGVAYVIFGSPTLTRVDLLAPGANGFRILGAAADDRFGTSVAGAGDVNNDGVDDVIIGAFQADPAAASNAGTATVIFGSRTQLTDIDLAAPLGTRGFQIAGAAAGDNVGWSVSGAGDANNDGIADVVIGAPGTDLVSPTRTNGGTAFIIYGSANPASLTLSSLGSRGFRVDGGTGFDYLGRAVGSAGDFNADGIDDVIIGAPWAPWSSATWAGLTYVVYGSGTPTNLNASTLPGARGVRFTGAATMDETGSAVAGIGDVNDDGKDDIIIGAPGATSGKGIGYVLFGATTPASRDLSASIPPTDGFRTTGTVNGDRSSTAIAPGGDVNSDGIDDFVIGAPGADPPSRSNAGVSYVVYGRLSASDITLGSLGSGGITINGAAASDSNGWSVGGRGDVNGDGRPDVLTGATSQDPFSRFSAGAGYAIFGFGLPSISYPSGAIATVGTAMTPLTPVVQKTGTATFSITPALPAGLSLDPSTGVISGTPTSQAAGATYSVTMIDAVSTASTSVQVMVDAAPTPSPTPAQSNESSGSSSGPSPSGGTTPAAPTLAVRDVAASNQASSATITSRVVVSGAGSVRQVGARATGQSARTIWRATARESATTLCTAARKTPRAGTYRMSCTLGAAARAELERRSITVRLATTFTPTGGTPITRTETVVLKRIKAAVPAVTG